MTGIVTVMTDPSVCLPVRLQAVFLLVGKAVTGIVTDTTDPSVCLPVRLQAVFLLVGKAVTCTSTLRVLCAFLSSCIRAVGTVTTGIVF